MIDYRAKAQEAIDAAYGDSVRRLFDAEEAHLTGKQDPPDTAATMQKIIDIHQKMTKIIEGLET